MIGEYFQINDWMLSVEENKLYRQDREVSVEPRLVNLLRFLAVHSGEVFGREELIEQVWDGAVVTDQVVTQSVFELRKLLRDGREENPAYLATVPKRGYKLVARVSSLSATEAKALTGSKEEVSKPLPFDEAAPQTTAGEPASNDIAFPAAPLTRAFSYRHPRSSETDPEVQRWKSIVMDVVWISLLIIAVAVFAHKQSETRITQALDTQLVEFKFRPGVRATSSDPLASGIMQKVVTDLASVSQYRIRVGNTEFTSGILPGKEVNIQVKEPGGKAYLDLEYKNNAANKVLFARQYPLSDRNMNEVLHEVSLDMMTAFHIPGAAQLAEAGMRGLPQKPQAMTALVRATHYLNNSDPGKFSRGIELLEKALRSEPGNAYLKAELYIAYYVRSALDEGRGVAGERVNILAEQLRDAVQQHDWLQPRVYEALALSETLRDDQQMANHYLDRALARRQSVLAYVLKGKQAELSGDMDAASEAYSSAFFLDTSLETYLLCENLAFYSNLKSIDYAMYRAVHPSVVRLM